MWRLTSFALVLASLAGCGGSSLYERNARRRAPRHCEGIDGSLEECALSSNAPRFRGLTAAMDGEVMALDRFTITYQFPWEFSHCGTLRFIATVVGPDRRSHETEATFDCEIVCDPQDTDVCFGRHHEYVMLELEWPESPFRDGAGSLVPGEYTLRIASAEGALEAEPIVIAAEPTVRVQMTVPDREERNTCAVGVAPGRVDHVDTARTPHDRSLNRIHVDYGLSRESDACEPIPFRLVLTSPDGVRHEASAIHECGPVCTPDGEGSRCMETTFWSMSLVFEWETSPFARADGTPVQGRYPLALDVAGRECAPRGMALSVSPHLDLRVVPRPPASDEAAPPEEQEAGDPEVLVLLGGVVADGPVGVEQRAHACRLEGAPDLSRLDAQIDGAACDGTLRACAGALRSAGCEMRRMPAPFRPPEIRCSGTRDEIREPTERLDPSAGPPSAREARALPPCVPACSDDYRRARENSIQSEAEWYAENQQRIDNCGRVR